MNRRNREESDEVVEPNDVDLAAGRIQPQEFPTTWVFSVLGICVFTTVGLIPLVAINIPPSPRTELPWWQTGALYQIYPRSFQDSDGDGVGDLKGIQSRVDYLSDLGVSSVWLTSIYQSPMQDHGFDVSDYTAIDPVFGTMDDFKQLLNALHDRDIKVVMDFIPNHSSSEHKWFQESRKGGSDNSYRDYYVWHDGKLSENGTREPPNNWRSAFGGSAWTWDDGRQQFYYHQFSKQQPDLNYREPKVHQEMEAALRFWLELGVDGFRVDAIDPLYEVEDIAQDEQRACAFQAQPDDYGYIQHGLTNQQPEVFNVTAAWRRLFDTYEQKLDKQILLLAEVWHQDDLTAWRQYYESGVDIAYNLALVRGLRAGCGGECISGQVQRMVANIITSNRDAPDTSRLQWMIGSHDFGRASDRVGELYMDNLNMLVTMLPGATMFYYGDELGMQDLQLTYEQTQDPAGKMAGPERYSVFSRDPSRAPMQWDSSQHAGFSQGQATWMPVHPAYKQNNVKVQQSGPSHLQSFRSLLALKDNPAFQWGRMEEVVVNNNIYSFVRYAKGWKYAKYLIAMNCGTSPSTDDYSTHRDKVKMPKTGTVVFVNKNLQERKSSNFKINEKIDFSEIELHPGEGFVAMLK